MKNITLFIIALYGVFALPELGDASLIANFQVQSITGGAYQMDPDVSVIGTNYPERYFSMGIINNNGDIDQNPSDDYISYPTMDIGDGYWDFADVTYTEVISNQTGANFYFYLWDEDDDGGLGINKDDSLGDHYFYTAGPKSGNELNNNSSDIYAGNGFNEVGGRSVQGIGAANNYYLEYNVWFEDNTGPEVYNPTTFSNGEYLEFSWADPDDPESGISLVSFSLWDFTLNQYLYNNEIWDKNTVTFGEIGMDFFADLQDNHTYWFKIHVTNGSYPIISNQNTSSSLWSSVTFETQDDETPPITPVPEPSTFLLLGGGLAGLAFVVRRRREE